MSIRTDQLVFEQGRTIRELRSQIELLAGRITELEKNLIEGSGADVSRETADLILQYEAKFGRPPHHRMKPETIAQALRE